MQISKIKVTAVLVVMFLCLVQAVQAQSICFVGVTINFNTPFGALQRYEIRTVETDYAGCREALNTLAQNEFQTWNVFWVSGSAILVDNNGAQYYFSTFVGPR
jgi:hypothetical protein